MTPSCPNCGIHCTCTLNPDGSTRYPSDKPKDVTVAMLTFPILLLVALCLVIVACIKYIL